jgi:hypothetical protein
MECEVVRMAYSFVGLFAKPPVAQPASLPTGVVWRVIDSPFSGVGIKLPDWLDEHPDVDAGSQLIQQFGLASCDWLFLNYVCWGGDIDYVYGFGCRGGRAFGPVEEYARGAVVEAYTGLMEQFGVSAEDALRFPPFVRGFWGEP